MSLSPAAHPGIERFEGAARRPRRAALLPVVFLISLMLPIPIHIGSFMMLPHRAVLLVAFVPLLVRLLSGGAGGLLWVDALVAFATVWAIVALLISGGAAAIEAAGIFAVEFFGAYLLARVAIRSRADFQRMLRFSLLALTIITPLALVESVTHRPILLNLIPGSIDPSYPDPRNGLRRAQAVFAHPILFGIFASSFFGIYYFGLSGLRRVRGVMLVVLGSILSLSTGALICIVIQAALVGWETVLRSIRSRWTIFAILALAAYITVDLLSARSPFHTLVQYASFNTGSAYNRIHIWNFGIQNVSENPMFGLGVNVEYWKRGAWMSSSTDNFWLYMTMAYGLPMIAGFVAAIVLVIASLSRARLTSAEDRRYRAGLLISLAGIIIAGGTVHYWHTMMSFVMFLFGAGLWMVVGTGSSVSAEEEDLPDARTSTGRRTLPRRSWSVEDRRDRLTQEAFRSAVRKLPAKSSSPRQTSSSGKNRSKSMLA